MMPDRLLRCLFILYFSVVGTLFVLLPWSYGWEQMLRILPYEGLQSLASPLARSALSGFGLVHLVWATYDFYVLLGGGDGADSEIARDQ